jgi:hypothetical protein
MRHRPSTLAVCAVVGASLVALATLLAACTAPPLLVAAPTPLPAPPPPAAFDCAAVAEIPPAECAAPVALYESTAGDGWARHAGWLATNTPCSWEGVICQDGHVAELHLAQNRLNGSLPPELASLTRLAVLDLANNPLTGPIPPELCRLPSLAIDVENTEVVPCD